MKKIMIGACTLALTLCAVAAPPKNIHPTKKPQAKRAALIPSRPNSYRPERATHIIQLEGPNKIIFDQRVIGMDELRAKINMVTHDKPLPQIIIRLGHDAPPARLDVAKKLLHKAKFSDIKIEKMAPPRKYHKAPPPKKNKWNPVNWF